MNFFFTKNENGGTAYSTSTDACLDFFININRDAPTDRIVNEWEKAFKENPKCALSILYNYRDIRGGKGERMISFICMFWLKCKYPQIYKDNLNQFIVDYGCWKDLFFLYDLTCKYNKISKSQLNNDFELDMITTQLRKDFRSDKPSLLIKWTPMENKRYHHIFIDIIKNLNMKPKQYRQLVSKKRALLNLVETNMSGNTCSNINFEHVPSTCHRIHRKAFSRSTNAKK